MFGNTYVCESTFSSMKQVKCKNRNQMGNGRRKLYDSRRLANTDALLIKEPPPQVSQ